MLFAEKHTESYFDTLPGNAFRSTQNAAAFARGMKRLMLRPQYNRFRIVTLAVIACGLAYFAFE